MYNYNSGGSIANDLQASFKTSSIFPLNKQKVINKLPNTDDSDILINDTVTDFLKVNDTQKPMTIQRKKKKI